MTTDTRDRSTGLKPADALKIPLPDASTDYVTARRALLVEEIELRRHATRVAEMRQALPPGPVIAKDYRFHDANGVEHGSKSLADLFGNKDTLVTYFWMYGPERERPCPMCTNWLGSVNGNAKDIKQRVALKIIGRSPRTAGGVCGRTRLARSGIRADRGRRVCAGPRLIRDDGHENPGLHVYRKYGDEVRLFWSSGQSMDSVDPGQDPRDAPDIASLWNVLDLTPRGMGRIGIRSRVIEASRSLARREKLSEAQLCYQLTSTPEISRRPETRVTHPPLSSLAAVAPS